MFKRARALLLAVTLSACSSPSGNSGSALPAGQEAFAKPSIAAATACSKAGSGYVFHGACTSVAMKSAGGALELKAYNGFTANLSFSKNDGPRTFEFSAGDALDDGDISGNVHGKAFPKLASTLLYFVFINDATKAVRFSKSPGITIDAPGVLDGVTTCSVATLVRGAWKTIPHLAGPVSGNVIRFSPNGSSFALDRGPAYFGIVCTMTATGGEAEPTTARQPAARLLGPHHHVRLSGGRVSPPSQASGFRLHPAQGNFRS